MLIKKNIDWKAVIGDVRFWIILFFVIRLYGITNPPIDPASTWRQCDVLMIARNFYELDPNILYPRVDVQGEQQGTIVGVEFPIYNYLIYLISVLFGYQGWYGRFINLGVSSVALFFLHKVLVRYLSREAAFNATLILLFSGWFSYARITIPDIFAASLCIISLHFAFRYFETGRWQYWTVFTLLATVGCMSKISAACLLTVLAAPMLSRQFRWAKKGGLILSAAVVLLGVCSWYFYWVPHLNRIGYNGYFFMGKPVAESISEILAAPVEFLREAYEAPLKYIGGTLFIFFSVYVWIKKRGLVFLALITPLFGYIIFLLKSGDAFIINGYYFLMLVPAMAVAVGFGLSLFQSRTLQLVLLLAIAAENIGNQVHVFQVRPAYESYLQLEAIFDSIDPARQALIAVVNDGSPMALYLSHRKGWNIYEDAVAGEEGLNILRQRKCAYILILKAKFRDVPLSLPVAYDSEEFKIYRL